MTPPRLQFQNREFTAANRSAGEWLRFAGCGVVLGILLLMAGQGMAAGEDLFTQGIGLSRDGQFPEAAAAFKKIAAAQPAAGTLVNLGLAEWQRGHAGAAILAWEQAQWIDPWNHAAESNLEFARQVAQVDPPELNWFEAISCWLSPDAWAWLACVTFWLAVALLLVPRVFRRRRGSWNHWLAALTFGIFLLSVAANFGVVSRSHIGYVVTKNAPLRLTPTHTGEITSTVAPGEPARRLRTRGDFVYVRTLNGAGWMDQRDFQLVCPR